jgi:hypothetical protein
MTVRPGDAVRLLWRSRIPIDNSHSVITVGPKIVRTRDAVVGSPKSAWTKPAPIEATPATTATQPSHRGYTRLTATAKTNRMNVAAAKTKVNRLARRS